MVINSIPFLLFFCVVFCLYFFPNMRTKWQNSVLFLSSLFFYGFADLKILPLLVCAILLFWILGNVIAENLIDAKRGNLYVCIGITLGIGLLLYFKYLNFFIQSFADLFSYIGLKNNFETLNIIMPLGISFFTFRLISYIVDIRRKEIVPVSLLEFATYISFFPCILSGPIDRSVNFLPQLARSRRFNADLAIEGCRQILWGMFKKMVIADSLSLFVNKDVATSNGSTLAIVAIMYSIQLYADFSGYSDMAIGVGKLLGIRINPNFRYPYFSRSIAEFWNRWHMSLLSWFRYYIYFPLGGSRCTKGKVIRNTFIVFLVSGLWHGANWTFVFWGLFHAILFLPLLLCENRIRYKSSTPYKVTDSFKILLVFGMVTIGWIVFRCHGMAEVWLYIEKLFSPSLFARPEGVIRALPSIIFAVIMFMIEWYKKEEEFPLANMDGNRICRWGIYVFLILSIIYYQGKPADFIYFKF